MEKEHSGDPTKKIDFKKDKNKDGIYSLTISYQTETELDLLVEQILKDIHETAELNNCTVEASIRALDESKKYWKEPVP